MDRRPNASLAVYSFTGGFYNDPILLTVQPFHKLLGTTFRQICGLKVLLRIGIIYAVLFPDLTAEWHTDQRS